LHGSDKKLQWYVWFYWDKKKQPLENLILCITYITTEASLCMTSDKWYFNLMCAFSECPMNDILCERDWIGYEAIALLHARIDDDKNGGLDRLESDEVTSLCTICLQQSVGIFLTALLLVWIFVFIIDEVTPQNGMLD
jgi:hypothetical protein